MQPCPSESQLDELALLYRQGKFLDAYTLYSTFASPESWTDPTARVWAGRLLQNIGQARRGTNLLRQTWQQNPRNLAALYFYNLSLVERHGPFEAFRFLREN